MPTPSTPPCPAGRPTIDVVARHVVERVSREEVEHYPALRDDFLAHGRRPGRSSPLGIGDVIAGAVTGIVLAVLHDLVTGSLVEVSRPWWRRLWSWVRARLGRGERVRVEVNAPVPRLTPDQAAAVVAAITAYAVRERLPQDKAGRLAAEIVRVLVAAGEARDDRVGG
ncbi:hypothetical protein GCM10027294_48810 [Marinactinospora endophytica]